MKVKLTENIDKVKEQITLAVEQALTASAIEIHASAVDNAPVKYGRLRASLGYTISGEAPKGWTIEAQDGNPSQDQDHMKDPAPKNKAIIGTNVVYAKRMEYEHKERSGYLRNALDANRDKCVRYFKKYLGRVGKV